jgi:hypothetical protein
MVGGPVGGIPRPNAVGAIVRSLFRGLIVAVLAAGPVTTAHAETQDFGAHLTYFYKQPSATKAAAFLAGFNQSDNVGKPNAHSSVIGFLAVVFRAFPNDIETIIPSDAVPRLHATAAIALKLAGQVDRARTMAERASDGGLNVHLDNVPASLDTLQVRGPMEFDLLWGATFAAGDFRYGQKILARYAEVANAGDNAGDMVAIVKARIDNTDLRPLAEKRGEDKMRELVIAASALWSLASNAQHHDFVRAAVDAYVTENATTPAAKALLALK